MTVCPTFVRCLVNLVRLRDAPEDAASHWTNRSPFPVLHLLREADVERALESKDGHDVWKRNVAAVEALGAVDMERRVRDCLT